MHPAPDGSLHVVLPDAQAYDALAKGWAVAHPLAGVRLSPGMVLVYGPRDAAEVEIVAGIAAASHRYATAADAARRSPARRAGGPFSRLRPADDPGAGGRAAVISLTRAVGPARCSDGAVATELDRRGVAAAIGAYSIWGLFPAFWPLLAPAVPVEVLAHRITWTAVLMVVVITADPALVAAAHALGRAAGRWWPRRAR